MAKHTALPQRKRSEQQADPDPANKAPAGAPRSKAVSVEIPANQRTTEKVNGLHVYVVKVAMAGSTLSAWCFLTHEQFFNADDFGKICDEVVKLINETRLPFMRKQMEEKKTPVPDPVKLNETSFEDDAQFFEAALCDKGFKKLFYTGIDRQIEPTVKLG
jgi:hypothetical protein